VTRFGTSIDQNTNFRLTGQSVRENKSERESSTHVKHFTDGVEEPTVRVDLLLILGFKDKDDLDRHQVIGIVCYRKNELGRSIDG